MARSRPHIAACMLLCLAALPLGLACQGLWHILTQQPKPRPPDVAVVRAVTPKPAPVMEPVRQPPAEPVVKKPEAVTGIKPFGSLFAAVHGIRAMEGRVCFSPVVELPSGGAASGAMDGQDGKPEASGDLGKLSSPVTPAHGAASLSASPETTSRSVNRLSSGVRIIRASGDPYR